MEQIYIRKTLNFENGSIEIIYDGIETKNDIDKNKVEQLLDKFIEKHDHNNMLENVTIVRTILKDYEEKLLIIYYRDEKGSELVKYANSNLSLFQQTKNRKKHETRYEIRYEPTIGIKLDCNNLDDISSDTQLIAQEISKIIEHIHHLTNVKAIVLNYNSKKLIEIYKLFYNENPNFTEENINIRVQTMMSILQEFGFGNDYTFHLLKVMPISLSLKQEVNNLFPFGEVIEIDEPIVLAKEPKNIIKIVGECIREEISNCSDKDEALITISKVMHARNYCLPLNSGIQELSKFTKQTPNEVESSIQLVKHIEQKINKD